MKFYLGVTDNHWFDFLSTKAPEDVNFWQPGGSVNFKVLSPGAPFLFKLKSPLNAIGGVGFFSSHIFLPISIAWETFGNRNGCGSYKEFERMILNYRSDKTEINPTIGCIVLTNPVFFAKKDWINAPADWGKSIVQGKSYVTDDLIGNALWQKVESTLQRYLVSSELVETDEQFLLQEPEAPAYGASILTKVRLGQGAFRAQVTGAYKRRCSISGERTLPVLEAAHIKPYAESGPHLISNGILLRSDMHKLFDSGYLTVTSDLKIEVSKRIKEEFENGREYYQYHGKDLLFIPDRKIDKPDARYIDWHNTNIFRS